MANWTNLKTAIANVIKTNGRQEITGQLLQNVLNNIVSSVGANATFVGIATPTTNPGTPDGPVFYIAGAGTYVNFNNITIGKGQLCILKWYSGSWSKELMTEINNSYTSISGVLNLTLSTCMSSVKSMKENELRLYIAGDSNGDYPAKNGDKYVKVNDAVKVANFLNTDESLYVNVGDIIAVIGNKIATDIISVVCRVIPLNDAKAGLTDGIMTKSDKSLLSQLNTSLTELDGVLQERVFMKSYSESNMNNALKSGVYPWCTLGRPTDSTGAYTCIVRRSFNADSGGYYTIEQTAYGREGELGQVYKRIIFQNTNSGDTQYGEWIRIDGYTGGSSGDDIVEFEIQGRVAESFSGLQDQQIPYTVRITSITGSLYYENTDRCVNFGGFGESLISYWQASNTTFFSIQFSKTGRPVGEEGLESNQPVRYKLKIKGVYGEDCYMKDAIG